MPALQYSPMPLSIHSACQYLKSIWQTFGSEWGSAHSHGPQSLETESSRHRNKHTPVALLWEHVWESGGTREAFSSEIGAVELRSGRHSRIDLAMRHSEEHAQQRQGTEKERGPGENQCGCMWGGRLTGGHRIPKYLTTGRMERQGYPVSWCPCLPSITLRYTV